MEKTNNSDTSVDLDLKAEGQAIEVSRALHSTATSVSNPREDLEPPQFDNARTKTLLRKLDWHLVPFLALLYL
jgi:hypothetical protein